MLRLLLILLVASTVGAMQHQLSLPESSVQEVPRRVVEMNTAHNNADVARRAVRHSENVPELSVVDVAATMMKHVESEDIQAALFHNDTMDFHIAHTDATASFAEPRNARGESSVVCTTCTQGKAGEKLDAGLATVGVKFHADKGSANNAATAVQTKANHAAGKAVKITAHATAKDKANAPAQAVKDGANAAVAGKAYWGEVQKPLAPKSPIVLTPVKKHTLAPLPGATPVFVESPDGRPAEEISRDSILPCAWAEDTKRSNNILGERTLLDDLAASHITFISAVYADRNVSKTTMRTGDVIVLIGTLGGHPEPIGTATRTVSFRAKQPVLGPTDESHQLPEKLTETVILHVHTNTETRITKTTTYANVSEFNIVRDDIVCGAMDKAAETSQIMTTKAAAQKVGEQMMRAEVERVASGNAIIDAPQITSTNDRVRTIEAVVANPRHAPPNLHTILCEPRQFEPRQFGTTARNRGFTQRQFVINEAPATEHEISNSLKPLVVTLKHDQFLDETANVLVAKDRDAVDRNADTQTTLEQQHRDHAPAMYKLLKELHTSSRAVENTKYTVNRRAVVQELTTTGQNQEAAPSMTTRNASSHSAGDCGDSPFYCNNTHTLAVFDTGEAANLACTRTSDVVADDILVLVAFFFAVFVTFTALAAPPAAVATAAAAAVDASGTPPPSPDRSTGASGGPASLFSAPSLTNFRKSFVAVARHAIAVRTIVPWLRAVRHLGHTNIAAAVQIRVRWLARAVAHPAKTTTCASTAGARTETAKRRPGCNMIGQHCCRRRRQAAMSNPTRRTRIEIRMAAILIGLLGSFSGILSKKFEMVSPGGPTGGPIENLCPITNCAKSKNCPFTGALTTCQLKQASW